MMWLEDTPMPSWLERLALAVFLAVCCILIVAGLMLALV